MEDFCFIAWSKAAIIEEFLLYNFIEMAFNKDFSLHWKQPLSALISLYWKWTFRFIALLKTAIIENGLYHGFFV